MKTNALTLSALLACACSSRPAPTPVVDPPPQAAVAKAPPAPAERFSFKRGVHVAHWLGRTLPEVPYPGHHYAADWFDEEDVAWIATHGFDHLAIEVDGRKWVRPDGALDDEKIAPFERALGWAKQHRIGVILITQALPGEDRRQRPPKAALRDEALATGAIAFWGALARRFAGEGEGLRFDPIDSPDTDDTGRLNALYRRLVGAVRETSPTRVVYVHTNHGEFGGLSELVLPDEHCIAAAGYFEPEVFASQGMNDLKLPPVKFPGRVPDMRRLAPKGHPAYEASNSELTVEAVDEAFAKAATGARKAEVYLSVFGVFQAADADSKRAYARAVRSAAERQGWGWAIYDYESGMAMRGRDGQPTPTFEGLGLSPPAPGG